MTGRRTGAALTDGSRPDGAGGAARLARPDALRFVHEVIQLFAALVKVEAARLKVIVATTNGHAQNQSAV